MRATPDRSALHRMWTAMSGSSRELAGAALLGSAASICAVALLGTAAWLIATAAGMPPVLTLTVAAVSVRFFALGRAVLRYAERLVGHDAAFRGATSLRVTVYDSLERLAPVGLARFARGDLLSRLVADVDAAQDLPLRVLLPWIQSALVLAACVAGLAWVLPEVAWLVALLGLVALLVAPWLATALAVRAERRVARQRAALVGAVVTTVHSAADLMAFGATDAALSSIAEVDRETTALLRRESVALGVSGGQAIVWQGVAVTGALAIGAPAVASGNLTLPWLAVIVLLPLALFEILGTLPNAALALQRVRGAADRLAEVVDAPDPVQRSRMPRPFRFDGARTAWLEVDGLSTAWNRDGPDALHQVSFTVASGSNVAIVGPSGSGKSTLAAVLLGFLDYRGSIRLYGNEVRDTDPDELREQWGYLAQRGHVFDTTIEENVRLGRPVDDEAQVWRALERAQLDDTVRAMPLGLQTMVGVFGSELSGGEAQRLSIARLMLQPPPNLLLDEPTEHLDPATAEGIDQTLQHLTAGRARVLITHRLSSIPARDQVLVIQEGRVTEFGSAERLIEQPGWFAAQRERIAQEADLALLIGSLPKGMGVPVGSGDTT